MNNCLQEIKTTNRTDQKHRDNRLPRHIQFVWHGINDKQNVTQFLNSQIEWGEVDIRLDIDKTRIISRHDSFEQTSIELDNNFLYLEDVLTQINEKGKSVKIDLKESGIVVDKLLSILEEIPFAEDQLWFTGNIEEVTSYGFQRLGVAYPNAINQCTGNFLIPMILEFPVMADDILHQYKEWGINRLSMDWTKPGLSDALQWLTDWGMEYNIYNVPQLSDLFKAVSHNPQAITSDFNYPEWNYFGRGSGANVQYHEYPLT